MRKGALRMVQGRHETLTESGVSAPNPQPTEGTAATVTHLDSYINEQSRSSKQRCLCKRYSHETTK